MHGRAGNPVGDAADPFAKGAVEPADAAAAAAAAAYASALEAWRANVDEDKGPAPTYASPPGTGTAFVGPSGRYGVAYHTPRPLIRITFSASVVSHETFRN